ncbi:MAG: DUF1540 domain-containing protein [Chloroflexota bacterium]
MTMVRCTVSNCLHWRQDNVCNADQILVTAPESPLVVAEKQGAQAEQLHSTPIRSLEDSLCYSFEAKD